MSPPLSVAPNPSFAICLEPELIRLAWKDLPPHSHRCIHVTDVTDEYLMYRTLLDVRSFDSIRFDLID